MGLLVDGAWKTDWYDTSKTGGSFERSASLWRNWITEDGRAGPTGRAGFTAEAGRYHLYVSYACPWAHRTLIMRKLKGLTRHIDVSVVHPLMLDDGWTFATDFEGTTGDPLYGKPYLRDIYLQDSPDASTRVTVPILWDKEQACIVSNESADIIRMFNTAFNTMTGDHDDYYPEHLRHDIDELNAMVYDGINNGVYKAGFATTQAAYEKAFHQVFRALDLLEARLADDRPFLMGEQPTEADWRLFPTLVRFDPVYVGHFKCNQCRIIDYPKLHQYLTRVLGFKEINATVDMAHIKYHYYASHRTINPHAIVPIGPGLL